ncbi:hypothetical protein JOD64_003415 [Micromonospora luteifusca]|uniref:AP2/ERF domain-containing protein n=1 Tax=Micromonospora luteifusca TaxID=709860 RepID=A0ABS2LVH8_9ACTN|nr:hypothetical protein [Micromonospora luteifusca]MBM7492193.1 hypothetical protein [Micromonospora luteifusca]
MQTILSAALPDLSRAAVIWLSLLGVVGVVVSVLLLRPGRLRLDPGARIRRAAMPSQLERAQEQREQSRYAQEIAVAAARATTTAQRRRAEWVTAQEAVEAAWQTYEAAEAAVRRLGAAAAMPLPQTARTPAEYADRERYLHRAALDAYWRRELSVEQLSEVFAHRDGWDPRLHPVEQELVLQRAIRDNLAARHAAAREQEQVAWRAAELAVAAARSLREEAHAATGRRVEEPASVLPLSEVARPSAEQTRENNVIARGRATVAAF